MSELQLYNSLTRDKQIFTPIDAQNVRMYVCGMTVYDFCHIGHARVMVVFDTLANHLRSKYTHFTYVRNITDIDDKIISRANENGENIHELTVRFIDAMHEDEKALGCTNPDIEPKATDNVAEMIELITTLIDKGHAYVGDNGDVYYSVRSFNNYGKLSNRNLDDLRAGERVMINDAKKDPLDFALWKAAKAGEPSWKSPWGNGRPGWHIECSVMSSQNLGEHFDIHGGGMDLKFPHHECEIAQSEGASGHTYVNYWIHNGFVQIDSEKMSKSLGNFFTVRDVLKKYDGEVIRFFMLQTHYRSPLNYSDSGLNEAKIALTRLYNAVQNQCKSNLEPEASSVEDFTAAMDDDLNTPKALAILFDITKRLNKAENAEAAVLAHTLRTLAARLGLLYQNPDTFIKGSNENSEIDENTIQSLVDERIAAKQDKNWVRADEIRALLKKQGIIIKDTDTGSEWSYI